MSRKDKAKKKKTAGDYVLTLVLIVAVVVFCYAAFNLYHIYTEYKKGTDEYNSISEMAVTERDPDASEDLGQPEEQQPVAPINVDFASLKSINDDVIGWIYMEALPQISYPMVQGKDNNMYLHQTYEKNYNFAGTIFIDYENKRDFSDCNTLVYGHNMKNGSMFRDVARFTDATYFAEHQNITIQASDKELRLRPVYCYAGKADGTYRNVLENHGQVIDFIKSHTGLDIDADDLYVLVTCSYGSQDERTYLYCVPEQ